ncbi:MAG: dihydroflavonol 4-reductase [Clostridiales bacterium]|nr:MAG: dihydroflavonol 4-reductase [Clostridiales bacterium]
MKKMIIITGASGHLGNTLIRTLKNRDYLIRGLILPHEKANLLPGVEYINGDVRDRESLRKLFKDTDQFETYVIHTAGIVDISEQVTPQLYEVNVNGTRNMIALCKKYHVKRLVYVSSVHAIADHNRDTVIHEADHFSADEVVGGYAKTKAAATQAVLDAAEQGLNAVVVHPSGILGPYDQSGNHLVQMVNDYILGHLPACVKGGYDFVDVRDVADGCIRAMEKGRSGECYILSNRHYEIRDVLKMVQKVYGGRRLPVLPMWMARAAAPFMQAYAKMKKVRPLYTRYSLFALSSNDKFSHDKATIELGYRPRDLFQTIRDTVIWVSRGHQKGIRRKKALKA